LYYPNHWDSQENKTIKVVSDFRNLNALLKNYLFSIPKIAGMIGAMDSLTSGTALEFTIGYYHNKFQKLCSIVYPWQNNKCFPAPIGVKIATNVFQNVMSKLVQDTEYVTTYIDELLISSKTYLNDHLIKLEMVQARLSASDMRVHESKPKFSAEQIQYLGY